MPPEPTVRTSSHRPRRCPSLLRPRSRAGKLQAFKEVGCTKIYTDTASGAKQERKGLEEAISYARDGDTLVVWRLDRLGRSLKHLIETVTALQAPTVLALFPVLVHGYFYVLKFTGTRPWPQ
ncbi:MAG: recombinase family protein, partial [Rhodopila sp.]